MTKIPQTSWQMAHREPFEAFGILYYSLFRSRADLPSEVDDIDMAWAVTADINLRGTGYTLSQASILTLAAYHHVMADLASKTTFLPLATLSEGGINPLDDIKRLVPDITAKPLYPDFPEQVMQIPEAQYRYHQLCHYLSTYGVEQLAGELGLNVTVNKGWRPRVRSTQKVRVDETLVPPKVLHVLLTVEDLQSVVASRLARATRMHEAEIQSALLVFADLGEETHASVFPRIAFHENMMELIRSAAASDAATLERVAADLAQHPGDLLKATMYLLESKPSNHLLTRQKKGLCRAFEQFSTLSIAHNIADADHKTRWAPNFLSVARFGGPHLREAVQLVETGQVRPWASELEGYWNEVNSLIEHGAAAGADAIEHGGAAGTESIEQDAAAGTDAIEQAWRKLLDHYGQRPGILFRSLGRLIKGDCPSELLIAEAKAHSESYSLPTLVRTLTILSERDTIYRISRMGYSDFYINQEPIDPFTLQVREQLYALMHELLIPRLRTIETPLRSRRVYLDAAGISLRNSLLMPNETGNTGMAWPPVGMAWDLPTDKTIRFFVYWDDRDKRVDVDLHFVGLTQKGDELHLGWNGPCRRDGLVMSGDIVTSEDSVEFLDADMREARHNIDFVVQGQHVYAGASNWEDIATCYSGAVIVSDTTSDVRLVSPENIIFRDNLTGKGTFQAYAVINFPKHYLRLLRGADIPLCDADFTLADFLEALFEAQDVTLVDTPDDADVRMCVARSDDPEVISLFDEGFFIA